MRKLETLRADPTLASALKQHVVKEHGTLSGHLVDATNAALKKYLVAEGVIAE